MEKEGIWSEEIPIRAFMVDTNRRATLPALANYLQEVAGNHANFRRIGFFEMQAQNRFWALSRLRIDMVFFPAWRERIRIHTWVNSMKGPFSTRNFQLTNEAGETLGAASTLWTAVDTEKRRPVRIEPGDLPVREDKPPLCGEPVKIEEGAQCEDPAPYRVRYSDLDMIRHVNNVKYIEWILDSYPGRTPGLFPAFLEVNYLGETLLGEEVHLHTQAEDDHCFRHGIRHAADGRELVRARIRWSEGPR